jgi:hypothetical protein
MVGIADVKAYLGIDYTDEMVDTNANRALQSAIRRMHGAIGSDVETYLPGDPRIDDLVLIYARESYDGSNLTEKERSALKQLRADLEPQLRLELLTAKAEAGVVG